MAPLATKPSPPAAAGPPLESAAGPVPEGTPERCPPSLGLSPWRQALWFRTRPLSLPLTAMHQLGDVWLFEVPARPPPFVVVAHPAHVESLLKAAPDQARSLAGESPLRPIVGPSSILTAVGDRHLRPRQLLLPPFHGDAVKRYGQTIAGVIEREIETWPIGRPFALAPRMQAVTLEVIMRAVFGLEGATSRAERRFRIAITRLMRAASHPLWTVIELRNAGRQEARGLMARGLGAVDLRLYEVIRERRAADRPGADVLSLLLGARDDDGLPLSDRELRDELMSLVLAGHETTANSLAWAFERLLRTPETYARLRELVRAGGAEADAYVEAVVHETMRARPVIPMIGRLVLRPWRFGEYVVPSNSPVAMSVVALHHRPDVYEDPYRFSPERFLERRPGTYTWIPFGGGIRRCLGASLAMAEQRAVLSAIARRLDLMAPDPRPERARQRNVTMLPWHGCRVMVTRRHDG